MEWLLPIIGWVLNLFLPGGSADRYWQGIAHGAAIVGFVWLGLHLMTRLKLEFIDLLIAVTCGGPVC